MPNRISNRGPIAQSPKQPAPTKTAAAAPAKAKGWGPTSSIRPDADYKARGQRLLAGGKPFLTTTTPPRKEDVLKEIKLTMGAHEHSRTRASVFVLKTGEFVVKHESFDSFPYYSDPMKLR